MKTRFGFLFLLFISTLSVSAQGRGNTSKGVHIDERGFVIFSYEGQHGPMSRNFVLGETTMKKVKTMVGGLVQVQEKHVTRNGDVDDTRIRFTLTANTSPNYKGVQFLTEMAIGDEEHVGEYGLPDDIKLLKVVLDSTCRLKIGTEQLEIGTATRKEVMAVRGKAENKDDLNLTYKSDFIQYTYFFDENHVILSGKKKKKTHLLQRVEISVLAY